MSILDWIQAATALASAIAAVLTWVAKLRWSKELAEIKEATISAKEAAISAKEAEIESLRAEIERFSFYIKPDVYNHLHERAELFKKQKEELENAVTSLKSSEAEKDAQIAKLLPNQEAHKEEIKKLELQRREYNIKIRELEEKINDTKVAETEKIISDIEEDLKQPSEVISQEKLTTYLNAAAVITGGLAILNAFTKTPKNTPAKIDPLKLLKEKYPKIHKNSEGKFLCPKCNLPFKSENNVYWHVERCPYSSE
jgi:DNA repair exonuclease SbcCD ATPase subunit